jgi:phosphoglycolate phosphatase
MTLYWDLDGPILDVSTRYYYAYRDILREYRHQYVTQEAYWAAKRTRCNEGEILRLTGAESILAEYQQERSRRIESEEYLEFDRIQVGTISALEQFSLQAVQCVVTLRTNRQTLERELERLDLVKYFTHILSSAPNTADRWVIKRDLIHNARPEDNGPEHVFIGDTETEVITGRALGFRTVAVTCGIRSRDLLAATGPDHIIDEMGQLTTLGLIAS